MGPSGRTVLDALARGESDAQALAALIGPRVRASRAQLVEAPQGLVPGDFCDLHVFILKEMDHSIATLSRCTVVKIPRQCILELTERPAIARALWWAALVDEATLREWLVNIGARPAEQRLAHLLCELLSRLRVVGLADGGQYELPVTQQELGDTTGMSNVHVNRVLQRLRRDGLITLKDKNLVILDVNRLNAFSGFTPNYLHLDGQNGVKEQSR
jgi:CRP-like cAMP-binding protein